MVTYEWNPFQERVDCIIPKEVIKPSSDVVRREFVPRYAPFFAHDFKLYRQGSASPLVLGIDYAFAHPFNGFVKDFNKNVYGSVVLLKPIAAPVEATYSTVGAPFTLDETAYAQLVANIVNSPRQGYWENLVDVPTEWPPLPHPHPAAQTYDYNDMMLRLENLILILSETGNDNQLTLKQMFEQHIAEAIPKAHTATPGSIGLDLVPNMRKATLEDLAGNSNNAAVPMDVLKEALRRMANGTLDLS